MPGGTTVRASIGNLLRFLEKLNWLAFLVARLVTGIMFCGSGWGKLHDLQGLGNWFGTLGIPFPHVNALFVSTIEFVGGACLVLGLGTRVFALLLSGVMAVALLTVGLQGEAKPLGEWLFKPEVLIVVIFIRFMVTGPGKVSIDAVIRRRFG